MGSLRNAASSFTSSASPSYGNIDAYVLSKTSTRSETTSDMRDVRCVPTYTRLWVGDTMCGCRVFETVLSNVKQPVERRPTDTERTDIIKSGNVFVYKERDNGIKRWTDGLHWSPSRISGNFLVYRELPGPFPPGHKKKAIKRKSTDEDEVDDLVMSRVHESNDASSTVDGDASSPQSPVMIRRSSRQDGPVSDKRSAERSLYGSLTKSYEFKQGGLMKKTMSVQISGQPYHLVAYYDPKEVEAGILKDSTEHEELANVQPRPDLLYKQSWRAPLDNPNPSPLGIGNPQSFPGVPHLGMQPQIAYQSPYGYGQPGPFHQYGYPPGSQYQSMNYTPMQMAPPNAYYNAAAFQGFSQSSAENAIMTPTSSGPPYHSYPQASFPYPGQSSTPTSPTYAQEFHNLPSPPSSRGQSKVAAAGYTILPSQNPRRPDGRLYEQSPPDQAYGSRAGDSGGQSSAEYQRHDPVQGRQMDFVHDPNAMSYQRAQQQGQQNVFEQQQHDRPWSHGS